MQTRVRSDRSRFYLERFRLRRVVDSPALLLAPIERPFERRVPAVPRYDGARFASIAAALEDKPEIFEHVTPASGSRDRREVVRALDRDRKARCFLNAAS